MRKLLILVLILGVVFVGGNVYGERFAEDRIAVAVRDAFGLSKTPEVEIDGFPIVMKVFSGSLPSMTVNARDVRVRDLEVAALTVVLEGIEVEGGLLGDGDLVVVVAEGSASAEVDEAAVNALLRDRGEDATITLLPDGRARVRAMRPFLGVPRRFVATGRLVLEGQRLVFDARRVTIDGRDPPPGFEAEARRRATVSVDLPKLPGGFSIDELATEQGSLTLTASAQDKRITLRGGRATG